MTKTIEACKVRKGQLILIEGKQGACLVTKREKWNSSHCRIYYVQASMEASFEYLHLDKLVELVE